MSDPDIDRQLNAIKRNSLEIEAAVAAERERCAVVVENMGRSNGRVRKLYKLVAAQIRSGESRIAPQTK